jgi:hypothetical protein
MSMFATLADLEAAKAAQKAQPAPAQEPDDYIVRTVERAIKEATQPQGMGLHDGMARIPASILSRLLKLAQPAPAQGEPDDAKDAARYRYLRESASPTEIQNLRFTGREYFDAAVDELRK